VPRRAGGPYTATAGHPLAATWIKEPWPGRSRARVRGARLGLRPISGTGHPPRSSETSRLPSGATLTPAGRPQREPSSRCHPATKSITLTGREPSKCTRSTFSAGRATRGSMSRVGLRTGHWRNRREAAPAASNSPATSRHCQPPAHPPCTSTNVIIGAHATGATAAIVLNHYLQVGSFRYNPDEDTIDVGGHTFASGRNIATFSETRPSIAARPPMAFALQWGPSCLPAPALPSP
jgi:hypothetical protein